MRVQRPIESFDDVSLDSELRQGDFGSERRVKTKTRVRTDGVINHPKTRRRTEVTKIHFPHVLVSNVETNAVDQRKVVTIAQLIVVFGDRRESKMKRFVRHPAEKFENLVAQLERMVSFGILFDKSA